MTIIWKPTETQTQNGIDEAGNRFQINHILETITVRTPDGFLGHGFGTQTIKEALNAAISKREEAQKSGLPQLTTLLAPPNLEADDLNYWTDRATTLLGCPSHILCGWLK